MTNRPLRVGDRVRLVVPTITGWRGAGTIIKIRYERSDCRAHRDDLIRFQRDGAPDWPLSACLRSELRRLKE